MCKGKGDPGGPCRCTSDTFARAGAADRTADKADTQLAGAQSEAAVSQARLEGAQVAAATADSFSERLTSQDPHPTAVSLTPEERDARLAELQEQFPALRDEGERTVKQFCLAQEVLGIEDDEEQHEAWLALLPEDQHAEFEEAWEASGIAFRRWKKQALANDEEALAAAQAVGANLSETAELNALQLLASKGLDTPEAQDRTAAAWAVRKMRGDEPTLAAKLKREMAKRNGEEIPECGLDPRIVDAFADDPEVRAILSSPRAFHPGPASPLQSGDVHKDLETVLQRVTGSEVKTATAQELLDALPEETREKYQLTQWQHVSALPESTQRELRSSVYGVEESEVLEAHKIAIEGRGKVSQVVDLAYGGTLRSTLYSDGSAHDGVAGWKPAFNDAETGLQDSVFKSEKESQFYEACQVYPATALTMTQRASGGEIWLQRTPRAQDVSGYFSRRAAMPTKVTPPRKSYSISAVEAGSGSLSSMPEQDMKDALASSKDEDWSMENSFANGERLKRAVRAHNRRAVESDGAIPELSVTRFTHRGKTRTMIVDKVESRMEETIVPTISFDNQTTAVHEVGHMVETSVPGFANMSRRFIRDRTEGLKRDTNTTLDGSTYETVGDGFYDPYVSRIYSHGDTEVVSTGMEALFGTHDLARTGGMLRAGNTTPRDPHPNYDAGHRSYILGMMELLKH